MSNELDGSAKLEAIAVCIAAKSRELAAHPALCLSGGCSKLGTVKISRGALNVPGSHVTAQLSLKSAVHS
jgi:hypothetical protein